MYVHKFASTVCTKAITAIQQRAMFNLWIFCMLSYQRAKTYSNIFLVYALKIYNFSEYFGHLFFDFNAKFRVIFSHFFVIISQKYYHGKLDWLFFFTKTYKWLRFVVVCQSYGSFASTLFTAVSRTQHVYSVGNRGHNKTKTGVNCTRPLRLLKALFNSLLARSTYRTSRFPDYF